MGEGARNQHYDGWYKMQVIEEAMHIEILPSGNSQASTVHHNIEKARRTIYCLTGAGLHGSNGLDPETLKRPFIIYKPISSLSWFMA